MDSICGLAICAAAYLLEEEDEESCEEIDEKKCEEIDEKKCEDSKKEKREISNVVRKKGPINPKYSLRSKEGEFARRHASLLQDEVAFKRYYHMSPSTFKELLNIIHDDIVHLKMNSITHEEKLSATIRFLASGVNYATMVKQYLTSRVTLGNTFRTVWGAILKQLRHVEMAAPTKQEWLKIADEFLSKWDFPQCLGAIGGKHFKLFPCCKDDSRHLIFLAVVDANYMFRLIDVGPYGRKSDDSKILMKSDIGQKLHDKRLDFPEKRQLPMSDADEEDFFFAANESFPLRKHIMRPYSGDNLSEDRLHFNDRLSVARNTVDRAFLMLTKKWPILLQLIRGRTDYAIELIEVCCVLHNFIEKREGTVLQNTSRYSFSKQEPAQKFTSKGIEKSRDHLKSYLNEVLCQADG